MLCGRLSELIDAIGVLRAHSSDAIFAELVESCTDLSATVLRPLLEYSDSFQLSPLTVLERLFVMRSEVKEPGR